MADLKCYYCSKRIFHASGTQKTFIVEVDPNAPLQVRQEEGFYCKESPSLMHFPEPYKIVSVP